MSNVETIMSAGNDIAMSASPSPEAECDSNAIDIDAGKNDKLQKHSEDAANNNGKDDNDEQNDVDGRETPTRNSSSIVDGKGEGQNDQATSENAFGAGASYF